MCISLDNRSASFTKSAIKNDELRKYANILVKDSMNIRANLLHMSAIMAAIASKIDDGILEEFDGSIVNFGMNRLGLKKTQVYAMVQVGATFLDADGKSLLPEKGGKWSNTQFMALMPMGGTGKNKLDAAGTLEACKELVSDGLIKPSMTVAEIKEVVAEHRPDKAAKEARAAKREAKKAEQEAAEKQATAKIKGTRIASIELWQLEDGSIYVTQDGNEVTITEDGLTKLNNMIRNSKSFKK